MPILNLRITDKGFQFLKGSIKRDIYNEGTIHAANFNSSKVRLKAAGICLMLPLLSDFNSSKVRLKDQQFLSCLQRLGDFNSSKVRLKG